MAGLFDLNPYATVGTGITGIYELIKSQNALNRLNSQPAPEFAETPELRASRQRADFLSQGGFTAAEKGGFRKNVAEDINTKSQRALDLGGGSLSKVIGGIGKIDEMGAESKFATSDAALHRQNIKYADKFSEELQKISDRNIDEQQRERLMAEQALGGAAQTGLAGIGTSLNYLGTALGNPNTTNPTPNTGGITADDYKQFLQWKAMQGRTTAGGGQGGVGEELWK